MTTAVTFRWSADINDYITLKTEDAVSEVIDALATDQETFIADILGDAFHESNNIDVWVVLAIHTL